MSLKKLKDAELNKLLDEVALDLNKAFGDVSAKLAKAEDTKKADMIKDEAVPEESESVAPEGSEAQPPPDAPPAPAAGPEAGAAPGGDPAQEMGGELTPEALQMEYEKLPPEELQMHAQALQGAMAKLGGGQPGQDPAAAGAPPAPEAAPAPAAAPPAGPPEMAMKSEKSETTLSKSEAEAFISLKEDVEILAKTLKTMIETPVRKAITSIAELSKGEVDDEAEEARQSLSPTEFWAKLKEVSKRSDLKKNDKQLICDIYEKRVQPEVAAKHLAKLFNKE